ncbi:hypothetical protein [Convivina praedatoris]|uniref:Uncharacterized protein n=1 Tax=Convivina praedatoris TaxID=2880963 RepID=A0ABN8H8U0_9LACO|nr:hypothetical protein [Convivina sp. LMG 32447]CAH1851799.1 hypothetical protein R077815_00404 [Convivina sp. LMG 32447]CAH1853886.1 hypothetical protein LMG032447_00736 [Convivina sp. LMG 32447]CAH1854195.1 hypothetical protein R078138_00826 [Convivina sp. LMG 32447]
MKNNLDSYFFKNKSRRHSSYWRGFQEGITESYIYDGKKRHRFRRLVYELGQRWQEAHGKTTQKDDDYYAGYHEGQKSEWSH